MFSLFPLSGVLYTFIFLFCEFNEYSYSFPVDGKLDIRHLIDPLEHYDSLDDTEDDNNKKIVTKSVFNVPVRYNPEANIHTVPKCPPGTQRQNNESNPRSRGPCVPMAPKITFGDSFLLQSFHAFLTHHKRKPSQGSGEVHHGSGTRRRRPGTRPTTVRTTTEPSTTTTTIIPTTTFIVPVDMIVEDTTTEESESTVVTTIIYKEPLEPKPTTTPLTVKLNSSITVLDAVQSDIIKEDKSDLVNVKHEEKLSPPAETHKVTTTSKIVTTTSTSENSTSPVVFDSTTTPDPITSTMNSSIEEEGTTTLLPSTSKTSTEYLDKLSFPTINSLVYIL